MILNPIRFLREARRRDLPLALTAESNVLLAVVFFALMLFDQRQVLGINVWIKPSKFALSIAIYNWTIAWFLEYLGERRVFRRSISTITVVCMVVEIALITLQAARGTLSHYNFDDALGGAIYGAMGAFIGINTVAAAVLMVAFWILPIDLSPTYVWSLRLGLLLFLAGSAVGGMLVSNQAHTVGAPDGGAGLPYVNWSTEAGDLRAAHAIGLHALQVIPFFGFLLTLRPTTLPVRRQMVALFAFAGLYLGVHVCTLLWSMAGRPLIPL